MGVAERGRLPKSVAVGGGGGGIARNSRRSSRSTAVKSGSVQFQATKLIGRR